MNPSLVHLSAVQLRRAADLQEQIESLQNELNQMLGGSRTTLRRGRPLKRGMSAAGRARIAAAARARWAKFRASASNGRTRRPKTTRSPQWRARLAAAARARWRKAKAMGKSRL